MGAAGSEAAMEAADIPLMTDEIGKIFEARAIVARAYRTIKENLIVGVGVVHVAGITAALLQFDRALDRAPQAVRGARRDRFTGLDQRGPRYRCVVGHCAAGEESQGEGEAARAKATR